MKNILAETEAGSDVDKKKGVGDRSCDKFRALILGVIRSAQKLLEHRLH